MQIKKLKLENFRGIQEIEIELLPNMNVFVGNNGAGKSTILDAIAISLSWLVNRIQKAEAKGMNIPDESIKNGTNYSSITIDILENNQIYNWKNIEFSRGYSRKERSNLLKVSELAYFYQEEYQRENKLPMIAYFPTTRIAKDISPKIRGRESISQLDIYDNSLGSKADFQAFFEWFRLQDDIINEQAGLEKLWVKEHKDWIITELEDALIYISDTKRDKATQWLYFLQNNDDVFNDMNYLFYLLHEFIMYFDYKGKEYSLVYLGEILRKITTLNDVFEIKEFKEIIDNILKEEDELIVYFLLRIFKLSIFLKFKKLSRKDKENLEKYFNHSQPIENINTDSFIDMIENIMVNDKREQEQELLNQERKLQIIRKAIEFFIPEYTNLRITRIPTPQMLVEKNGETLSLNQLSNGEKVMIAIVGDIARRLSMANPNLHNPLEGNGIVMIDEVDLHLHPAWQQKILDSLQKTFPNVQFIVTTHSQQVLTTVKSEGIQGLVLKNNNLEIKKFDFSLGAKSHELLNEILGVNERPQNLEIVKDLNRYLELVDENLYNDEEAIKLREKLDAWGAGKEKDLLKADMDIRLKEYRRKKYEKS